MEGRPRGRFLASQGLGAVGVELWLTARHSLDTEGPQELGPRGAVLELDQDAGLSILGGGVPQAYEAFSSPSEPNFGSCRIKIYSSLEQKSMDFDSTT